MPVVLLVFPTKRLYPVVGKALLQAGILTGFREFPTKRLYPVVGKSYYIQKEAYI